MKKIATRQFMNWLHGGALPRRTVFFTWLSILFACVDTSSGAQATGPLRLHPENPRYFEFRGKPAVLITAGEHYGAVINRDFDYVPYLDELARHRFNLTRIFSGTYREVPGSFNITGNTLAPAPGKFLCPWARSGTPGASDGGNKFDLTQWNDTYFSRLKDFVAEAGKRGIIVELVFFCTMYDDKLWNASPMNASNNVNGIGAVVKYEVYNGRSKPLVDTQKALVRKLVTELNAFDNLYYEVCNEPYERGGLAVEWNNVIVDTVVAAESSLPKKHLVAQGFPHSKSGIKEVHPNVSILNFHAAPVDLIRLNWHWNRVLAFDETGGSDRSDRKYRTEGWQWIIAGGGVYDHLDFSFTTDRPEGSAVPLPSSTPGGGGPELRRQLRVLKDFIHQFDFVRMKPDNEIITAKQVTGANASTSVRALAEAGRAYAIYVNGGTLAELTIKLPPARYESAWVNTRNGEVNGSGQFTHAGGDREFKSPEYSEDIALRIVRGD